MITIGLLCVIIAWALQFVFLLEGEKEISWLFTACYSVGVFLLVVADYVAGNTTTANLNLLVLILSMCVMLMIMNKNKICAKTATKKPRSR
jgi:hypothetical protein